MKVSRLGVANSVSVFSAVFSVLPISCCVFPVALSFLGASGLAFAVALTPYRPYFIALTLVSLGAAFYFTCRHTKRLSAEYHLCSADTRQFAGHCLMACDRVGAASPNLSLSSYHSCRFRLAGSDAVMKRVLIIVLAIVAISLGLLSYYLYGVSTVPTAQQPLARLSNSNLSSRNYFIQWICTCRSA